VWGLSHRELYREVVIWAEQQRASHNRDMTLAWQTANLTNAKKLPSLERLLVKSPEERVQTTGDMKAMLFELSKRYGGKVRTHG
jgi:hypothetical protein